MSKVISNFPVYRYVQGVKGVIAAKGPRFERLFDYCYRYKRYWLDQGFNTPILNALIFKNLKAAVGGRLNSIVSGGAPLAPDVQDFFRVCMFDNLLLAYGLTESAGI